jgi:hypothetical protein
MANTIATGLANDAIAQESLAALVKELSWFKSINFRPTTTEVMKGQNLVLTIPSTVSAQTFGSSGYANADQTLSSVSCAVDQHKFVAYGILDGEQDSSLVNLVDSFAQVNAHALATAIITDVLADVESAKTSDIPSAQQLTITEANFGLDDLISVGADMDEAGIPQVGRWALLSPAYHAKLENELITTISNSSVDVSGTLTNGVLGRVRGFDIFSCPSLSSSEAVFGVRDSLLVASAVPGLPEVTDGGQITYVTEPSTGLTVQRRVNYDYSAASLNTVMALYYGSKVVRADTLFTVVAS